tara:strand:- start:22414 stop:23340 length:927 start_codon:yes stop_codon:yes gene_type:complete
LAEVLVTGGCGFIGRAVVHQLVSAGHEIRILDNLHYSASAAQPSGVDFIRGSTASKEELAAAMRGVDRCIHLAGSPVLEMPRDTRADESSQFNSHAEMFFSLAADQGVPVVYASSAAVYGELEVDLIGEHVTLQPVNAHGMEKAALEHAAVASVASGGPTAVGLRMFNVYGPGQSSHSPYCSVVRLFADRLVRGLPIGIRGTGNQQRDFVYVDDAARAIVIAAFAPVRGAPVVNICTGRAITLKEVVGELESATGLSAEIDMDPAGDPGVARSVGRPDLARELLGFEAEVDFRSGIQCMMAELVGNSA